MITIVATAAPTPFRETLPVCWCRGMSSFPGLASVEPLRVLGVAQVDRLIHTPQPRSVTLLCRPACCVRSQING